ncbi:MAG: AMP-dependent synthetase/ligase [Trebonia sp.]
MRTPDDIAAERAAIESDIDGMTLLTAFAETASAHAEVVAHRWQEGSGWRSLTCRQVYDRVRDCALGLRVAGLEAGDFVVIWSGNRSEATIADYAVLHARGVPVFIYNTASAEQAAYVAGHCEATRAIIEQRYLPQLLSVKDQLPRLREIILIDGENAAQPPGIRRWAQVLSRGGSMASGRDLFEESWQRVDPGDLAALIYTSGTVGQPKAVMLTHRNLLYHQQSARTVIPLTEQSDDDGITRVVSYLPMAHVTGRTFEHWEPMTRPVTLTYCPGTRRLFEMLPKVHPTALIAIPGVWEKLHAAMLARLPDASPELVSVMPGEARLAVLTTLGLDRCRVAMSGAAPLDEAIVRFFRAFGLPLTESWGMAELSNTATLTPPGAHRPGTVGRRFPGMEVRITGYGEILARGPLVMRGYHKDPQQTLDAIDPDGWLHTGDVGSLDSDGFLTINDRKTELIVTSGGKSISPSLVERELQRHALIGHTCVIGDKRSYPTALITLDPRVTRAWARSYDIEDPSPALLASHPVLLAEAGRGVAEANERLARPEQVRRFLVLGTKWTTASGELTPTLKPRRQVIATRYEQEIHDLYS